MEDDLKYAIDRVTPEKDSIVNLPGVGMKIQAKDEEFVNPCWVQGEIGTVIKVRDDSVIVEFENCTCPMWPEEFIILQEETNDA